MRVRVRVGGCVVTYCGSWVTRQDLTCCDDAPLPMIDRNLTAASEILYQLTGERFGTCLATFRPCCNQGRGMMMPMRIDGEWVNSGACGCFTDVCGCRSFAVVDLGKKVQEVVSITIDGVPLESGDYWLNEGRYLIKTEGRWPNCQDMSVPEGPGTWIIEVVIGTPVPESLKQAAASLASEMVKACQGDPSCRLPAKAQTVAKQGLTIDLLNTAQFTDLWLTPLEEVNLAVAAFNPDRLRRPPKVVFPEVSPGAWNS